ncbi:MAG: O-acetyl-ADP-ribose deacetylase [Opitutales bacterium]
MMSTTRYVLAKPAQKPSRKDPMANKITILRGDLTRLEVDVIVNAANQTLLGGGGVDGAIHRAAGHDLLAECSALDGCETGQAKITDGHNLPAKHVIHTVGPVWGGGARREPKLLASCYRNSFRLAREHDLRSLAFPAISCGIYRFPFEQACRIALKETLAFIEAHPGALDEVIFCCFDQEAVERYEVAYAEIHRNPEPFSEKSQQG